MVKILQPEKNPGGRPPKGRDKSIQASTYLPPAAVEWMKINLPREVRDSAFIRAATLRLIEQAKADPTLLESIAEAVRKGEI
jgi:hypothetical protein